MKTAHLILFILFLSISGGCGGSPAATPPSCPSATSPAGENFACVDLQTRFQTMIGFGANGFGRFDDPHMLYNASQRGIPRDEVPESEKQMVFDWIYSDLGLNTISIALRTIFSSSYTGWRSWEPVNDNNDPFSIDRSSLQFDPNYWDEIFRWLLEAMKRIRARGEKPVLLLKDGWGPETWMADPNNPLKLADGMEAEYAEWVLEFILYGKEAYGITFDYVSVMNEPDGAGSMEPAQMVKLIKAMRTLFDQNGVTTQLMAPETYLPEAALPYLQAIAADPQASSAVKSVAYHNYDRDLSVGALGNIEARRKIRGFADQLGAQVYMTELSTCCKQNLSTFWNNTYEEAMAWANDFYNEIVNTNAAGVDMQSPFWSDNSAYVLLRFDGNKNYINAIPSRFYYLLGQFTRFIKSGMVRVQVNSSDPEVLVTAFVRDSDSSIVLVVVNNSVNSKTLSLYFSAQTPTQLTGTSSSRTENWKDLGTLSSQNSPFNLSLSPQSVTTLGGTLNAF